MRQALQECKGIKDPQTTLLPQQHGKRSKNAAYVVKLKATQKDRPMIKYEDNPLNNVLLFKYPGSIFSADGSHHHDVTRRIVLAKRRCGHLRNIFTSPPRHPTKLKISIYKSAIVSLLTYGCEAWSLTPELQARINSANTSCLARITHSQAYPFTLRPVHARKPSTL